MMRLRRGRPDRRPDLGSTVRRSVDKSHKTRRARKAAEGRAAGLDREALGGVLDEEWTKEGLTPPTEPLRGMELDRLLRPSTRRIDDALLYADVGLALVKFPFKIASMFQHASRASDIAPDPARLNATPPIGSSLEPKLWKLSSIPVRLHSFQVLVRRVCSPRPSFVPTRWNYASESTALLRYGSTYQTLPPIGLLASSVTSERRTLSLTGGPWLLRPPLANRQSVKPYDRRVQRPAFVFILSPKDAVRVPKIDKPDSATVRQP